MRENHLYLFRGNSRPCHVKGQPHTNEKVTLLCKGWLPNMVTWCKVKCELFSKKQPIL